MNIDHEHIARQYTRCFRCSSTTRPAACKDCATYATLTALGQTESRLAYALGVVENAERSVRIQMLLQRETG